MNDENTGDKPRAGELSPARDHGFQRTAEGTDSVGGFLEGGHNLFTTDNAKLVHFAEGCTTLDVVARYRRWHLLASRVEEARASFDGCKFRKARIHQCALVI